MIKSVVADGELMNATVSSLGTETDCANWAAVKWNYGDGKEFEILWIDWNVPQGENGLTLRALEDGLSSTFGDLTQGSVISWDHYMDYHPGLLVENCDPIIKQLREGRQEFFFARHLKSENDGVLTGHKGRKRFVSIFLKDSGSQLFEITCYYFSTVVFNDIPDWNFCLHEQTSAVMTRITLADSFDGTKAGLQQGQPQSDLPSIRHDGLKSWRENQERTRAASCFSSNESNYRSFWLPQGIPDMVSYDRNLNSSLFQSLERFSAEWTRMHSATLEHYVITMRIYGLEIPCIGGAEHMSTPSMLNLY
jgi:hypothetical protein